MASLVAEIRKMIQLRTHLMTLIITVSLLMVALALEASTTVGAGPEAAKDKPLNLQTIWKVFHFFSQHITPLVLAITAAYQIGKEFEWKTFHQIQLKGQTPLTYILSKLGAFYSLATLVYLVQVAGVIGYFVIRSAMEGQSPDIPFLQIFGDVLFYITAIPIAVTISILTVSASGGIILALVYLGLLEMMIFPLIGSLMGVLNQHAIATALGYTPMRLPVQIVVNSETFLEGLLLFVANAGFIALILALGHLTLNRRQIGLVR